MSALATAAVVALAALAAASPASSAHNLVIRLRSITVSASHTDKPPKGTSSGDTFTGHFLLLNVVPQFGRKAGVAVGAEVSSLKLTSRTTGIVEGVVRLPGGSITYQGTGRLGSNHPIAVTGGTGRFAGARGTLSVGSGRSPLNTYTLTLP